MDKKDLRQYAKKIRKTLEIVDISKKIVKKIGGLSVFLEAKDVMIYYPLPDEIDLLELTKYKDKRFYLPRVNGDKIECCGFEIAKCHSELVSESYNDEILKQVQDDKELVGMKRGNFGIMEPIGDAIECPKLDIIFVPALAVDKNGNRLGYGGGYYDRFCANEGANAYKIVPIAKELVFDNIPTEEFDVKVDLVVTD